MTNRILFRIALLLLLAVMGLAQQQMMAQDPTDPTRPPADPYSRGRGEDNMPKLAPTTVTRTGEILIIDTQNRAIKIRDEKLGKEFGLALDEKCKIKGDKSLFGKKDLQLSDLRQGLFVEITLPIKEGKVQAKIIEIKVPKKKNEGKIEAAKP